MDDKTIRDDLTLTALLQKAAKHIMTPEEVFEQRVSFVYGQLMDAQPNLTKDHVRATLRATMGRDPLPRPTGDS